VAHEFGNVVSIETRFTQARAVRRSKVMSNKAFDLGIKTSTSERMLDVCVGSTSLRIHPNVIIRPFAFAKIEKDFSGLYVHFDDARPSAFGLIKNDQPSEEVALSNFQS